MKIPRSGWIVGAIALTAFVMYMVWMQTFGGSSNNPPASTTLSSTEGGRGGYWMLVAVFVAALIGSSFLPKGSGIAMTISAIALVALLVFGPRTTEVAEKIQANASGAILDEKPKEEEVSQGLQPPPQVQPQQQQLQLVPPRAVAVTESQSKWATGQASSGDAGIPVGVWSEEVKLKPGCRVTFASGSAHKVEYRYYSRKWLEYIPGTSPEMSGFRTMVTEEGVTEAPYTMTCF